MTLPACKELDGKLDKSTSTYVEGIIDPATSASPMSDAQEEGFA